MSFFIRPPLFIEIMEIMNNPMTLLIHIPHKVNNEYCIINVRGYIIMTICKIL